MSCIASSTSRQVRSFRTLFVLTVATLALWVPDKAIADELFQSPQEAVEALVNAAKSGDRKSMLAVLGRRGADIVSSGDEVADGEARQRFLSAYDAKHQLTTESDRKAVLIVGPDDFPFPIPLVQAGRGMWKFDTEAGRYEILRRRIGRNELATIQSSLAYVDAQNEYAEKGRDGAAAGIYAQRIVSHAGKQDGLYWPSAQGGDASPLGDLVARATGEGYRFDGGRAPFHGYYYKILTRQGPNAAGGALNYVVGGKMIGGFALVAYPAEYRNSGVMTFMVNHQGTVFQKDLGKHTSSIVGHMTSFNPDRTWKKVDVTALPSE
jgi:hypothetical protein